MEKFIAFYDLHYGTENRGGHKISLHDERAMKVALAFAKDFKPDHVILGGDILDCACISHHNHGKPGTTEGMRLIKDAHGLREDFIKPVEALKAKSYTYIIGNHEDWVTDLIEQIPALEGIVNIKTLLKLDNAWKIIPNGGTHKLGKLYFIHGDQLSGGEHASKAAVIAYEKSIRFGHFHTYASYTKTSCVNEQLPHTGISVPCLCKRSPAYGGGKPNRWSQGFLYGYITPNGVFSDYIVIITDGKTIINGKQYKA